MLEYLLPVWPRHAKMERLINRVDDLVISFEAICSISFWKSFVKCRLTNAG